ncbi:N-acetylmuramoyl-L-alanine amidase [Aneurinibacillus migulanus]|uniref:N-acetylmuramoyl-L-alanine amidase n=1 Tax=Aneurinibacillus migulanus TaxID=47500 RepID=UPI0006985758|nr:N-acetylmuramoyl-L-alanine amidase [Aneurinibacillus migulanus]
MRKRGLLLWAFLLIFAWVMPTAVQAAPAMSLVVNGKEVKPDVPPQLVQNRTMIPLYFAGEAYGVDVKWNNNTRTVTIDDHAGKIITMKPGNKTAYVNGKAVTLEVAPKIIKGRTFLPLRQVGDWLGATVGWDAAANTVTFNDKKSIAVNGNALTQAPVYQLPYGHFVRLNDVAKPLGYEVKKEAGKVILEQGAEKYTISQASAKQANGYRLIDGYFAVTPEFLSQVIGAKADWNENKTACTLDKLQYITGISRTDDGISVESQGKMSYSQFTLDNPDRIVIDFNHARLKDGVSVSGTSSKVENVRYSQYSLSPDRVRVVLEMSAPYTYGITATDGMTKVTLQQAKPTPTPTPKPGASDPFVIVLDPGHGGSDSGAVGTASNYEKNLVLSVAKVTESILKQNPNFKVIMTRSGDTYPTLKDRVNIANNAKADVFLSFHANSATASAHGTETYYKTAQSKEFAAIVHKHLVQATGFTDRGLRTANFYVVKNTKMPSTLIEIGFLTNAAENKKMLDPAFQKRVGEAVAAAIVEYYNKKH